MHNKILKGIASVLSAALVLGSVVTGVVPAQAATSTKTDAGYETAYVLADCELIYQADTATITGNKIEWTNHWGNIFYKIPQEIIDADLIGFYCKGTMEATDGVDLKIVNADDVWGTALVDKYTGTFEGAVSEITADQRANATGFCIMSLGAENESMSATVENVIFITEKAVAGASVDTPSTGDDTPSTGDDTPAAATPDKAKISDLTAANGKVTVKWAAVDNANKYVVYRSTSKSGGYKKVGTTKKASYNDKTVESGATYFYKVKAVNKTSDDTISGKKSAAKKVTVK